MRAPAAAERINDRLRAGISLAIRLSGLLLHLWQLPCIRLHPLRQRQLARRYGVAPSLPVRPFSPALELRLRRRSAGNPRLAATSGTSGGGKQVPYNWWRLQQVKLTFVAMFARLCWSRSIRRTGLFVFAAPDESGSLTSVLLEEKAGPSYLSGLQAPYRVLFDRGLRPVIRRYGLDAVQLWILAVSNPGVLYSTNPSTLWAFFSRLEEDWPRAARLVREYAGDPLALGEEFERIGRRIASSGADRRLRAIAESSAPLPLATFAPAVTACICWTGGQVGAFLERLEGKLSGAGIFIVPMFSMSTETVETVSHFGAAGPKFLPMARGVHYEFQEEGVELRGAELLRPGQLRSGKDYSMIVSDGWGLLRYRTDDVFRCRGFVGKVPDLEFAGRRGLSYSFTGEKLTGAQIDKVLRRLGQEFRFEAELDLMTCFPFSASSGGLPHYKIAVLVDGRAASLEAGCKSSELDRLACRADELLCKTNPEYKSKRRSQRLGKVEALVMRYQDLPTLVSPRGWHSQFKHLPFYPRLVAALPEAVNHSGAGGAAIRNRENPVPAEEKPIPRAAPFRHRCPGDRL